MFRRHVLTLLSAAACFGASTLWAAQLPSPSGSVLLEVTGAITHHNDGAAAVFDADMLRNLEWVEVETYTSFTDGPQVFAGPTLASLIAAVGADAGSMNATAMNDYFVTIPVAHAEAHDVILAVEHNGKRMRVRDKGPIWVVYPLSEERAAEKPFDSEMIWQLNRIEFLK